MCLKTSIQLYTATSLCDAQICCRGEYGHTQYCTRGYWYLSPCQKYSEGNKGGVL